MEAVGPRKKLLYFPLTSTSKHTWSDSLLIPGLKFREIFHDFPVTFSYCLRLIFRYKKVHACVCVLSRFSHVQVFATLWTIAHQAPLSMGFSRQEYWGGLPCPPPGDLPNPGIEPTSLMSPALAGGFFTASATWRAQTMCYLCSNPAVASISFRENFSPYNGMPEII